MINTGLDALLKQRGIKSLLMTGVATDTCVEATARDAYFIDYYVTLVQDCCAHWTKRTIVRPSNALRGTTDPWSRPRR